MDNATAGNITLANTCPICGKKHTLTLTKAEYYKGMREREAGALIQNAFPGLNPSQREFFITGICDECWGNL